MKYYFIGINGSGMSSLAKALIDKEQIIGSDYKYDNFTDEELSKITLIDINNIKYDYSYTYIISNAYLNYNFVKKIIKENYHFYLYHTFIANYFKDYRFICIAGSHGKTITSSMLSYLMPDYSHIFGASEGVIKNNNLILEACEYKESFLAYNPDILVVLNIDYDHVDYYKTKEEYLNAYKKIIDKSPIVIACGDDENINKIKNDKIITYGISDTCDYSFKYKLTKNRTIIYLNNNKYVIPYVGKNYAYCFVSSLIVTIIEKADLKSVKQKIINYTLPNKRLEKIRYKDKIIITDYAHHPKQLFYLYKTLKKECSGKKMVLIFEGHTLSRIEYFKDDFKSILNKFDSVYLLDIYSAKRELKNIKREKEVIKYLGYPRIEKEDIDILINKYDVIILAGAGIIYDVFKHYKSKIKSKI